MSQEVSNLAQPNSDAPQQKEPAPLHSAVTNLARPNSVAPQQKEQAPLHSAVTNFARFYGILKKRYKFATKELGDEFKEGVVSQFTNGRTTSLRDMTRKEYDMMCDKLEDATAQLLRSAKDEQRRHRSRCLRLMQMLGIDTTDWTRINAFCQDQRIAGKVFSKLSNEELEQLSVKLRSIQRKGGLKPKKEPTPAVQPQVEYMMLPTGNGGEV